MGALISKAETVAWFLARPELYRELIRRVVHGRVRTPASEARAQEEKRRSTSWCTARAAPAARVLESLGLPADVRPFPELEPELWRSAHEATARCPVKMGGPAHLDLVHHLVRHLRPWTVVETGVASGWSSLAMLAAMERNTRGHLFSVDMPYAKRGNDAYVGVAVPHELRKRWTMDRRPDRDALPEMARRLSTIDVAHYDSDKSHEGRSYAYPMLWSLLRPGGLLISDDVEDNSAFAEFAESCGVEPWILEKEKKGNFTGILVKPHYRTEKTSAPVVSIVSVNWKVPDLLRRMIDSIPKAAGGLSTQVIVVDNDSGDGSVDMLREHYPDVLTIASPTNLGFGRGCNLGLERAAGEFVAFVNPDCELHEGSLAALVDFARRSPRIGLIGPKIRLLDGSVQSSAANLPDAAELVRMLPGATQFGSGTASERGDAPVRCGAVHGSCLFLRREALLEIGGIPAETFMYGEEVLLGHRLRRLAWEVWYVPGVEVTHVDDACADLKWIPHEKALKKREAHVVVRREVFGPAAFRLWNAMMASKDASRWMIGSLTGQPQARDELDFVRLHVRALMSNGRATHPLSDRDAGARRS
jgi:GT2 family glycosyltransferase/predicted O-methyltransferase YrrM